MNDIIFIKDEADYIKYSKLKPKTINSYKKVKFICSICNKESEKTFRRLTIPFVCTECLQKIKANSDSTKEKRKLTNIKKFGTEFASQSDICKQHLIDTCKEKYNVDNPFQIPEIKKSIKENNIELYGCENPFQSEIIKNKIKNTCLEKYGVENPMQIPEIRKTTQYKYRYNNLNFDSSWELAYYIWLKDNNIDFEYQPDISFDYEYDNKIHKYFPDFKVNNEYIEIKGSQFIKENEMICPFDENLNGLFNAKYKCMIHNKIKILLKDDIKNILNYVKNKYGKNYLLQFKNN